MIEHKTYIMKHIPSKTKIQKIITNKYDSTTYVHITNSTVRIMR
jgi:hypothetical protein